MKVPEEVIRGYDAIDAKWRCVHRVDKGIFAEVIDKTTDEKYAEATGATEAEAVTRALDVALVTPKPLTRSQKSDPIYAQAATLRQQLEEANAEIAKLRASASSPKPRRGKKAEPDPQDETEEPPGFPDDAEFPPISTE